MNFLIALIILECSVILSLAEENPVKAVHPKAFPQGLYPGQNPGSSSPEARGINNLKVLEKLTGVTGVRTDAITGTSSGDEYAFLNLRVQSAQTTFDDYLIGYYKFDFSTQHFTPTRFEVAPGAGIMNEEHNIMLIDNTKPIHFRTATGAAGQFQQGTRYNFTSGQDYYTDLSIGQSMCFTMRNNNVDRRCRLLVFTEDGTLSTDHKIDLPANLTYIPYRMLCLIPGVYRLRLEAVAPAANFTYQAQFYNENAFPTTTVSSSSLISASLGGDASGYGLPYKKFLVSISAGQTLTVPFDEDTHQFLLDGKGKVVAGGANAGFIYTAAEKANFYIVIAPASGTTSAGESYFSAISIADGLGYLDWTDSHNLRYGKDGPNDDADGDGLKNLLEYSFGLNPRRSDSQTPVFPGLTPSQFVMNYRKADYAQGVTLTPQFSVDGTIWSNGTGVAGAATGDGSVSYQAASPLGGKRTQFSRIKVTQTP